MTESADAKKTLIEEFKDLSIKQWVAIIASFAIGLLLITTGLHTFVCMGLGFFLIAVIIYMVPHILGVTSPKIKAVIGATFLVVMLLLGAFAYPDCARDVDIGKDTNTVLNDVTYDNGDIVVITDKAEYGIKLLYAPITEITFGQPTAIDRGAVVEKTFTYDGTNRYTCHAELEDGKYYLIEVAAPLDADNSQREYYDFLRNTGISSGDLIKISFVGAGILALEIGLIFFVMLIFSELMRRSARKTREKMEKDGRLYPQGYSKCKECGTMVLPGEITCRKCGAPIDVPDDVKVLHKKDFFECSECGTEVPMDAKVCPKCGAVFDEEDETEITHVDGTVDSSTETFECSECGKTVPANAKRCPYCGAEFDEDDE
jgi:uncharacterized OB-fold protein